MNSQPPLKRKIAQSLIANILILSTLAGMLSACNMIIVTPKPTVETVMELTPTQDLPATQELTLVSPTEGATEMPTLTLTTEPTITLTPEPTETQEKEIPSDFWQLSPDGHVFYNEKELYDGLFTINKEHPEYVEKYWEDVIKGMWNLNNLGQNMAFVSQFPSEESLISYLRQGGGEIDNLLIPIKYPEDGFNFRKSATLVPTNNPVDLTKISFSIYKPSVEEIYNYNPSYSSGTEYVSFEGAAGEVWIKEVEINSKNTLNFIFRRDLLMDALRILPVSDDDYFGTKKEFNILAITEKKSPEENLLAATQLISSWPLYMNLKDSSDQRIWMPEKNPPLIFFGGPVMPLYIDFEKITTLETSPLSIR